MQPKLLLVLELQSQQLIPFWICIIVIILPYKKPFRIWRTFIEFEESGFADLLLPLDSILVFDTYISLWSKQKHEFTCKEEKILHGQ